ncbi:hypothetical protein PtB15_2B883 [Puccinia triticina]|nr:hypothetical protein PtB15_2B883 [Puccinia triticina]
MPFFMTTLVFVSTKTRKNQKIMTNNLKPPQQPTPATTPSTAAETGPDDENGQDRTITLMSNSQRNNPSQAGSEPTSHGSPRSILSWHYSDIVSIPSSSRPSSELDDQHDFSDLDLSRNPSPIQAGEESDGPHQTSHHLTAELLSAVTDHLVMPRLPMVPTPSNHSSRPASCRGRSWTSESAASLRHRLDHHHPYRPTRPSDLLSKQSELTLHPPNPPLKPLRILIVGDTQNAHGLGSLNTHLAAPTSLACVDRTAAILPEFKFSDPQTYNQLIQHIEAPLYRLKSLLNPKACIRYQSSLAARARNDLLCLVERWIEREGYLLLLVEVDLFPVPPARLEFLRTLSRMIPTIPFIPSTVSLPQAIDGHAILTRQLAANRLRHFSIPKPCSQSFALPEREECAKRSSRACLDWLAVEYASSINTTASSSDSGSEHDPVVEVDRRLEGEGNTTDDFEPDKISERVSRRVAKKKGRVGAADSRLRRKNSMAVVDGYGRRECQAGLSTGVLGLPSLAALVQLGLYHLRRDCRRLFKSLLARLLHSSANPILINPNPFIHDHASRLKTPTPDPTVQPALVPSPPSPPSSSPSSASPTTWLIIGFLTATTAATFTVWWRQGLLY